MTAVVVAAVIGYLVGSASPASILARARGVDLRGGGSGNPGATNAARLLGRKAGVLVALLDVAKGALPAAGFGMLAHEAGLVAGAAAVLGHVTSPWLRGRGGKGAATAGGAILGSHPLWAPVVVGVWVLVVLTTRWVALASILAALALPVVVLVADPSWVELGWALPIALLVVFRHRNNVARWWAARRAPVA
ncbi:MAG TPA: glycerol-3-phosphate 1-O-acyltransferase PlsY [Mycobacteriales bacterium]|nr:glycerol-3-phosphate 1-O-acyltransferase PlsY [Mycobacteriales bacterium]